MIDEDNREGKRREETEGVCTIIETQEKREKKERVQR